MTKREAIRLIKEILSSGRKALFEHEAKELLSACGITVPKSVSGQWSGDSGLQEIKDTIINLTPPFVLKIISSDKIHKSDVGGVVTGLRDEVDIRHAIVEIENNVSKKSPQFKVAGFLLEEMVPKGVEIIIGGLRDEQFGPVIMFGAGGIAFELMNDKSYRLAPVDKSDALAMMKEIKSYPMLTGFRGTKRVDLENLADIIVNISNIITEVEEIKEVEINPLIASEKRLVAVDARVLFD